MNQTGAEILFCIFGLVIKLLIGADSQKILRKILRIIILLYIIPKQSTVKAHLALFEGEGRGKKMEEHFPEASA